MQSAALRPLSSCARFVLFAALLALPLACGSAIGSDGESDAGPSDAGAADSGTADSGSSSGTADSGPIDSGPTDAGSAADAGTADAGNGLVAARPYHFHVPAGYSAGTPAPLLLMLHGYTATAAEEESYLGLTALSDEKGFLYAYPDGTIDQSGEPFWNATDACCNFYGSTVDDVAYLSAVIDDVEARYNVDSKRIYIYGHSNGAFMANRLGCELSERIAALVSMAGDTWEDQSHCTPTSAISMVQFQGTADQTVSYTAGTVAAGEPEFPGAAGTVADWAALEGCTGGLASSTDTVDAVSGKTTNVSRYAGCPNGSVELWTVQGGPHIPQLVTGWYEPFWTFLAAHAKP